MNLFRLIYFSKAESISRDDIESILASARAKNESARISGMLVYSDGKFTQLLEGPRNAVTETFLRIMHDPRHREVELLLAGRINARLFQDWSMRYVATTGDGARLLERFQATDRFQPEYLADAALDHFFAEAMMLP